MKYPTNAIASLNGVIRSSIKTKRILWSDESALKIVWIAVAQASNKWTKPISNWHRRVKSLLREELGQISPSSVKKLYTVYLTELKPDEST